MSATNGGDAIRRFAAIVVDDDSTSRAFLRMVLEKSGYDVVAVESVAAAQKAMLAAGWAAFDCVLTDHLMPELSGLDLLAWLKVNAPDLAAIIITAAGEKKLVAESLRGGAADFLEKPVNVGELRESVAKAVELTQRQRRATEMALAVQDLGRTQQRMIHSQQAGGNLTIELCSHPKREAGGDSFTHFQTGPDHHFCLLTDVSGHDLRAAYLSAYFQGVVRGMLECGAPVPKVFQRFNQYLIEEWNQPGTAAAQTTSNDSVAACAVAIDLQTRMGSVLTCGLPAPVVVTPDGRARHWGLHGGFPLGWFPDFSGQPICRPIANHQMCLLRTDGIEDLAAKLAVDPLSVIYRLRTSSDPQNIPGLNEAEDDILAAVINLPEAGVRPSGFFPLVLEETAGDQAGQIDALEQAWRRSVRLALPELAETVQFDLLLSLREAVLNGFQYGCGGAAGKPLRVQLSVQPEMRIIRAWVEDPGCGHDFDLAAHTGASNKMVVDKHRGLLLIHHLTKTVTSERHGATLIMDFAF